MPAIAASVDNSERPKAWPTWAQSLWSMIAAFGTYFCVYAFRKPFTAGQYDDLVLWGIGYKTILVSAQVIGYTLSKFIGIKVIAEITRERRAIGIIMLIGFAEAALLLFGLTPAPYNFVFLFVNGLPLGMAYGLVLGFLEGRVQTEALAAGLCASFIVADGVTKSVGAAILTWGVSAYWMPFVAGALFVPPVLLFVWMLTRIPPPTARDVAARSLRVPMNSDDRWRFFRRYALGLSFILFTYLLITILRSIRADFAREIWAGLSVSNPSVYATSEMWVGAGVMTIMGLSMLIRNNRRAFFMAILVSLLGPVLVQVALLAQHSGAIGGYAFMVLVGFGLYLPYVAAQTALFERLIAMTRTRANIGYLVYLADAFGYLGYVVLMVAESAFGVPGNFLKFFVTACWVVSSLGVVCLGISWWYFARRSAALPVSDAIGLPAVEPA